MRLYAMETGYLSRLLDDRRELLAIARGLKTATEMREARADLIASAHILLAPGKAEDYDKLYMVDANGVAHIPVVGELTPSAQTDACGAYTAEALTEYGYIRAALAKAESDPLVSAIALDVNSPGGYIDGVDLTAQAIASASKPVTAYVDGMAASAAYWLASQADSIVALSPASRVGSIGVALEEYDDRAQLAAEGIAHRVYTSTDAPDKRPDTATDEGRAKIIGELDALHAVFARRVAEGRHVTLDKVSKDFGRGGVLTAEAAMAAGMIDEVRGSHISRPVSPAGVASSAAPATAAASPKEEVHMDLNLDTLKAEHADIYAAVFAEGKTAGIQAERERREQILGLVKVGNAEARKAANEAIASGDDFATASPKIVMAALEGTGGENAPAVGTAAPQSVSGASNIEEAEILAKAGLPVDYLKGVK